MAFQLSVIVCLCRYQVLQVLDRKKHPNGPYLYYILNTLLICLLVLHVYWWVLIWRMIMRQIQNSGKVSEDVRSGAPLLPVKRQWRHLYWEDKFLNNSDFRIHYEAFSVFWLHLSFLKLKPYIEDLGHADSDSDEGSDDEDKDKTEWWSTCTNAYSFVDNPRRRTSLKQFALRLWFWSLPQVCWSSLFMRFIFRCSS